MEAEQKRKVGRGVGIGGWRAFGGASPVGELEASARD